MRNTKDRFFDIVLISLCALLISNSACRATAPQNEESSAGSELAASGGEDVNQGMSYPIPDDATGYYPVNKIVGFAISSERGTRINVEIPMKHCTDRIGMVMVHVEPRRGPKADVYIMPIALVDAEAAKVARCSAKPPTHTTNIFVSNKPIPKKDINVVVVSDPVELTGIGGSPISSGESVTLIKGKNRRMHASFGQVTTTKLEKPNCAPNQRCQMQAVIGLSFLYSCSGQMGAVRTAHTIVDPRNDDPNINLFIGAVEVEAARPTRMCIVAPAAIGKVSVPGGGFPEARGFTEDDVSISNLLPKPARAFSGGARAIDTARSSDSNEESGVDDVLGGRMTCAAFWSGYAYSETAKACERRGGSGCSNPFPYETLEACQADNGNGGNTPPPSLCMAHWEGFAFNKNLKACEFRHGSGCSNPFEFKTLGKCLKDHPEAVNLGPKPSDGVTCMAFWEGFVVADSKRKCVAASASGCSNPFPYTTLKQCRQKNGFTR